MSQRLVFTNGTSPQGLGKPVIGLRGDSQPMHPYPALAISELDHLLGRGFAIHTKAYVVERAKRDAIVNDPNESEPNKKSANEALSKWCGANAGGEWDKWFPKTLKLDIWSRNSADETIFTALRLDPASPHKRKTLADWIDDKDKAVLLSEVRDSIRERLDRVEYNARRILERDHLVTFLFTRLIATELARGSNLPSAKSLVLRIAGADGTWRDIYEYALLRSAWLLKDEERLEVDNQRANSIVARLLEDNVTLSGTAFKTRLDAAYRTEAAVGDKNVAGIINLIETKIGKLQPRDQEDLYRYFDALPDNQLKPENEAYFVARASNFLLNRSTMSAPIVASSPSLADDYTVDYYDDTSSAVEYDVTSVQAAAQLFFVAIWGDELGLFEVIDRLASQATPELRLDLTSKETLQDLQLYVLDERFRDTKTGEASRRVPRPERAMFYRQVFGMGEESLTAGMRANTDFPRLWAVLMNATAAYIQKVEESVGNQMVSSQKIIQAVEDLRYNLSMACSGMAKVASPVVYKEMDFVIRRLLGSKDITSLVGGGSFWKVVERVRGPQGLTPLRTKGRVGHQIMSMIATEDLSNEATLQKFVMAVEAYIVAESQLVQAPQGPSTNFDDYMAPQQPTLPGSMPGMPGSMPGANGTNGASNGASNWDF